MDTAERGHPEEVWWKCPFPGVCGHRSAGQEQLAGMEPRRVEELMLRDRGEGQGGVTLCQAAELGFCPVSNKELTWS